MLLFVCILHVCFRVYRPGMCGEARPQRKIMDSLDLQSQVVMNHPLWVLGTKLRSSARTAKGLDS